jgi:hypothetical protein
MNYIRKQQIKSVNSIAIIGREIRLIKKYYSFIDCKSAGKILYCIGHYQPTSESPEYQYLIKYEPIKRPVVTVTSHDIEYNDDIHLYPEDNSLCLYHKSDLTWDVTCHLHDTIIPWTHEWFVFYELYEQ